MPNTSNSFTYKEPDTKAGDKINIRLSLSIFSTKLERRLREHDSDYGPVGWLHEDCSISYLHRQIMSKMSKLTAMVYDCNSREMEKEVLDIANFCMMISDRIRARQQHCCRQGLATLCQSKPS